MLHDGVILLGEIERRHLAREHVHDLAGLRSAEPLEHLPLPGVGGHGAERAVRRHHGQDALGRAPIELPHHGYPPAVPHEHGARDPQLVEHRRDGLGEEILGIGDVGRVALPVPQEIDRHDQTFPAQTVELVVPERPGGSPAVHQHDGRLTAPARLVADAPAVPLGELLSLNHRSLSACGARQRQCQHRDQRIPHGHPPSSCRAPAR